MNKSGYEIRLAILDMAKDLVNTEYSYELHRWESSAERCPDSGKVLSDPPPAYPGLAQVFDTARQLYDFVSTKTVD